MKQYNVLGVQIERTHDEQKTAQGYVEKPQHRECRNCKHVRDTNKHNKYVEGWLPPKYVCAFNPLKSRFRVLALARCDKWEPRDG